MTDPESQVQVRGNVAHYDIWYPRSSDVDTAQIGLVCVRASDDIRVTFDFDRDGWSIQQEVSVDEPCGTCSYATGEWVEVYFAPAWALRRGAADSPTPQEPEDA